MFCFTNSGINCFIMHKSFVKYLRYNCLFLFLTSNHSLLQYWNYLQYYCFKVQRFNACYSIAINFGIWLTPVFYSTIIVPDSYKNLYRFANPLATAMEGMRAGLFQSKGISMGSWVLFLITLFCLFIAFFIFTKFEKRITEKL